MIDIEIPAELRSAITTSSPLTIRLPATSLDRMVFFWSLASLAGLILSGYLIVGGAVDLMQLIGAPILLVSSAFAAISCAYNVWGYEELEISRDAVLQRRRLGRWGPDARIDRPWAISFQYRRAYTYDGLPASTGPWLAVRSVPTQGAQPTEVRIGRGLKLPRGTLESIRTVLEQWANRTDTAPAKSSGA